jgi:hypothetical protein
MVGDFLRFLKSECLEWHRSFLAAIPGEIGCKVRNGLYGYHAERGCRVLRGVTIYFPERLKLAATSASVLIRSSTPPAASRSATAR